MVRKFSFDFPLIIVSLSLLLLYFHHASRDIYGGDVGDLTTAACVGGVPHPPGFPLFSLLGFGLCQLSHVFSFPPVLAVGIISIVAGTFGVGLFYLLAKKVTNQSVALLSALVLAFSYLYWLYSELAEVFVLNAFFAILLVFLAERFRSSGKKNDFFLLCFFAGLATTNHQTIIFVFPAILLLIFQKLWEMKREWKVLLGGVGFGILGFSVYGYSIIASLRHPALDWAHITSLQSFLDMILRKRYGTFSAGVFDTPSSEGILIILKLYFQSLVSQITFPGFVLCLIGIDRVLKLDKVRAIAYATAFFLTGPLFFSFAGFPLMSYFHAGVSERFLLLSTVIFLLFLPYGCQTVIQGFYKLFPRRTYSTLLQCVLFIIPILLFVYNYPKTNLAPLHYGDNVGKTFLAPLPPHAVVLMDGDTTLFNTWYIHLVLHYRPDVTVVNMYSLYDSPYYMKVRDVVKKQHPHLPEQDLSIETIKQIDLERPFFSRMALRSGTKEQLTWVPYGLVHELRSPKEPKLTLDEYKAKTNDVWSKITIPDIKTTTNIAAKNLTLIDIPTYYANGLLQTGGYFLTQLNDGDTAYAYYKKALAVDPTYARAYAVIGIYLSDVKKDCRGGEEKLEKAISLEPTNSLYYFHLYTMYRLCSHDTKRIQVLDASYQRYFNNPLEKDLKKYIERPKSNTEQNI